MRTNTNGRNRIDAAANRRGWKNPARRKSVPVAEWEAEVSTKSRGPDRPDRDRKVKTVGIVTLDGADLFDEIRLLMRKGYEVRLSSRRDGECLRFFPCLTPSYDQMFVAAQTMGSFRTAIGDIPFRMSHRGKEVDPRDERAAKERRADEIREARRHVTPDTLVTCPQCGCEFRVGKTLD